MASIETPYEEIPAFADLEVGTVLNIVDVEHGETEKQKYKCFTLTLDDNSKVFGTQAGVIYQLNQVKSKISKESPLRVRVSEYKNKMGNYSKSIKNA